jgi:hypothetical protein
LTSQKSANGKRTVALIWGLATEVYLLGTLHLLHSGSAGSAAARTSIWSTVFLIGAVVMNAVALVVIFAGASWPKKAKWVILLLHAAAAGGVLTLALSDFVSGTLSGSWFLLAIAVGAMFFLGTQIVSRSGDVSSKVGE